MLDIVASYHCMQFHGKRMIHTQENGEKPHFGPDFCPSNSGRQNCFPQKNLASSVTRFHGQPLLYTISEKINDPILRKLSDGRIEGRTDKQTDWRARVIS